METPIVGKTDTSSTLAACPVLNPPSKTEPPKFSPSTPSASPGRSSDDHHDHAKPPLSEEEKMSWFGNFKFRLRLLNPEEPLYLPKGSVRALITLIMLVTVLFFVYKGVLVTEQLWTMVTAAVFYYFGYKTNK